MNRAPSPAEGMVADGFAPVAAQFATQLRDGSEIGAGLTVYHRGQCVVDLWGGRADRDADRPWTRDTRIVVFSVTKGLAAMAFALLADRGRLDWDAPVARWWPGFAAADKQSISVATLLEHRAGLVGLDERLTMNDCVSPARRATLLGALERQRPAWEPGTAQGYHAITWGMYARELFERVSGEGLGGFLERELFAPLGADVSLGTPAEVDARIATLYPPRTRTRVGGMLAAVVRGGSNELRILRAGVRRGSPVRAAFLNPRPGPDGIGEYNSIPVRRAELAWASATASAHGLARGYLPFAGGGAVDGHRFLQPATLAAMHTRQGWSERDLVLNKPVGWSRGFLKEEPHLFSPEPASFGHAGMGGALGWCDPIAELAIGYAMNRLDWRVRSPRAIALCRALYTCAPIRDGRRR